MPGAQIILFSIPDTNQFKTQLSDSTGKFFFNELNPGKFRLKILMIGYQNFIKEIEITDKPIMLRKLTLQPDAQILKQVDIEAVQIRQEQKGDTTQYNADAFKVNKDASTEDLVKKMPGVTIENGTVKHQGEDVKKVLIDGREFFGDDANIALKNLPAEMVDKVQVYDRASDQGFFSGFDDGNAQKTMNILTKNNKNKGTFGKAYGGYGVEDNLSNRYQAGANYNLFKGIQRISIVGMSNNINMQNFGSQDLLGLTGSQGGQRGGMGGGMMGGGGRGGGGSNYGSNNPSQNFTVGQQGGISTTHSVGFNYTDAWGKKILTTASYFFNLTDNDASSELQRNFFSAMGKGQAYGEDKAAITNNGNHRFNLRMEYYIDTMNSVVFNPRISFQSNEAKNNTNGLTIQQDTLLSSIQSIFQNNTSGFNANNLLLYRKKLKKYGRTFSIQLNADVNDKSGNSQNRSENGFYTEPDTLIVLNQNGISASGGRTYGGNISYTEPLGKYWALQAVYNPSLNLNYADKKTYNFNNSESEYSDLDSLLSNEYNNRIETQKGGVNVRLKKEMWMLGGGLNYQVVNLKGDQQFPNVNSISKSFENFLPNLTLQIRFSKSSNLRFNYRTNTNLPTINQLQNVIDNSNTLFLSSGNSDLRQNYSHFANIRYNYTQPSTSRSFFFFIMTNIIEDYIGNSTFIARKDTFLSEQNIFLRQGTQLNRPVNLDGNWVVRSYTTYSTPIKKIKSTLNINLGFSYSNLPGLINDKKNIATTTAYNTGLVLASNISDKLDFTLSWNAYFNYVNNSLQSSSNNNYLYHLANGKLNWNFYKSFFLASEINYTFYDGLESNFNQQFSLWNNSIAWKFLKNNSGEIKFSVYDVLKQNNSVSRSVTETYIEDLQTKVLQRYYMATFTWTFRKFQKQEGGSSTNEKREREK